MNKFESLVHVLREVVRLAFVPLFLTSATVDALGQDRSRWPAPDVLARQFERIAFTSEYGVNPELVT